MKYWLKMYSVDFLRWNFENSSGDEMYTSPTRDRNEGDILEPQIYAHSSLITGCHEGVIF